MSKELQNGFIQYGAFLCAGKQFAIPLEFMDSIINNNDGSMTVFYTRRVAPLYKGTPISKGSIDLFYNEALFNNLLKLINYFKDKSRNVRYE